MRRIGCIYSRCSVETTGAHQDREIDCKASGEGKEPGREACRMSGVGTDEMTDLRQTRWRPSG